MTNAFRLCYLKLLHCLVKDRLKKYKFSLTIFFHFCSFIIVLVLKEKTSNRMSDPQIACSKSSTKWEGKDECLGV